MKVIHYTESVFKLRPIIIKNGNGRTGILAKPQGGLWCSPLNSKYGWKDWCKENDFGNVDQMQEIILNVDMINFVVINSIKDMETKLPWYKMDNLFDAIDFENLVRQGFDGVYLTIKGEGKTRYSSPHGLYGWDCETILILNERCIK